MNDALWFRRFGLPAEVLTLETAALKPPPAHLARVEMLAAPLNPSDLIPITGAYRHRVPPPRVAGYEGVGKLIEAEGDAAALVGRRVLPLRGSGTWQRFVDCDPRWMIVVPDDIGTPLAAQAYINPLAALLMLETWPVKGRRVLLTAAGSTCANLLAQWAIGAGALEVAGIHRSPEHGAALSALGVLPIHMGEGDRIAASASRADIVFDAVGGELAEQILGSMRGHSAFVSYGLLSGTLFSTLQTAARPQRFHLRDRLEAVDPCEWQGWFDRLWPMLRSVAMPEHANFALPAWKDALALFQTPGRRAKPVFRFDRPRNRPLARDTGGRGMR